MSSHDTQSLLESLRKQLYEEMKKYNRALEENAGYDIKKAIRTNMRWIQQEITNLLPAQTDDFSDN